MSKIQTRSKGAPKLNNPLYTLDLQRLKKDLPLIRGDDFNLRFIRKRTVFFMDGYRYAFTAARKRWKIDFAFFEAGHNLVKDVYISDQLNKKAALIWWKLLEKDRNFSKKLVQELQGIIQSGKRLARSIPQRVSPEEAKSAVLRHRHWWIGFFELAYLWFCLEIIQEKIDNEVRRMWKGSPGDLEHFLSSVYRPVRWPRSSQEQRDLLNLARLKGLKRGEALERHYRKYRHLALHDTIGDKLFDKKYFEERLRILNQSQEFRKAKESLDSADRELKYAAKLLRSVHLPVSLKRKIDLIRWYMFLRTESVDYLTYVNEAYQRVFNSIAENFGLRMEDALHMTYEEIVSSLTKGALTIPKRVILERTKSGYAYLIAPHGSYLLTGPDVDRITHLVVSRKKEKKETEVKGQTAFAGKVIGRARVILDSQKAHEVHPGEILITAMTNPEFVPAMKRSAGIITNEGGILCHAAIMSRELRKPCITATKNATDTFKTGDQIVLDAGKGIASRKN